MGMEALNASWQTSNTLPFSRSRSRLTQFFYLDGNGPHQLVGSSAQFAIGLSDPSEWHVETGEAADPSVIPGAFTDGTDTWTAYIPTVDADGITFKSTDGRWSNIPIDRPWNKVQYQAPGQGAPRSPYSGPKQVLFRPDQVSGHADRRYLDVEPVELAVLSQQRCDLAADGFISATPFSPYPKIPIWNIRKAIICRSRCRW